MSQHISPPPPPPAPVPSSASVLKFPVDHYLHAEAPTEWWWHTGTLTAGGRTFGFEINAAAFYPVGFTQVMLTDVANQKHYQATTPTLGITTAWASSDPTGDWFVKQGDPTTSTFVTMTAPHRDPTHMTVHASFVDGTTTVSFALTLQQQGPPFIVWGNGEMPNPPNQGGVTENNYYYSLTRLHATGTITLTEQGTDVIETHHVLGLTWMDHEYGKFGTASKPVLWFLQDMQLDNGVHISNSLTVSTDNLPKLNQTVASSATIQFPDGTTYFDTTVKLTPINRTWTNPDTKSTFFLDFTLEIPDFHAHLTVTTLVENQDFPFKLENVDTYEGVATVKGTFLNHPVHGTAWNEQQP